MKSTIISVGTELLFGQIVNTNTVYLSQELNHLGIDVLYHHTVGDNPKRLQDALEHAFMECDLIITTGGLGPTQDDLTKEIAAKALEDELVLHQPSLDRIASYFQRVGRPMTENNKKQAYLPQRATIFENNAGTAPGFALEKGGKTIICLPGPPREMKTMFQEQTRPYLESKSPYVIYSKMLRIFGIGESAVEDALSDLISAQTDPTLATYAKEGEVALRITSKRKDSMEAEAVVFQMISQVRERLGNSIYSLDDQELHQVVGEKLIREEISISCAESCTGGLFAATLVNVPGISRVLDRSLVTYSNEAKMEELGVHARTLDRFGAVSQETAEEMAEGLRKKTRSRLCISVTGIAGPDGGTDAKPVGLCFVTAILDDRKITREFLMRGTDRIAKRRFAVLTMLDLINQMISNIDM